MQKVIVKKNEHVHQILLNRPSSLNALDEYMIEQLNTALAAASDDPECKAIVLAGEGRAFCSGKDMKARPDSRSMERKIGRSRAIFSVVQTMREAPKPVIAAVHGHAVGAGFAFAAASDMRVVAPDVKFAAPFTRIGLTPGDLGLSYFLPRIIGFGRAAELFYTSGTMNATQAVDWGFATRLSADPIKESLNLASELSRMPQESLCQTKELFQASLAASSYREHLLLESRSQVLTAETDSHQAAVESFQK